MRYCNRGVVYKWQHDLRQWFPNFFWIADHLTCSCAPRSTKYWFVWGIEIGGPWSLSRGPPVVHLPKQGSKKQLNLTPEGKSNYFPLVGKQEQNILQVLFLKWLIYLINLNIFDHFTDKYWEIPEWLISQQAKIRIFNSSISLSLSIRVFQVSVNSRFCPLPK